MRETRLIRVIILLFLILGTIYAVTTPVFEASDELWHFPMVQHLAEGNPLPVQVFDPAEAGPWKQEASQPPLYYYLGAALTFWIDTTDLDEIRWLNPHVDNGVITSDGNTNLVIHDPAASPLQGTLLAVRLVRIASVAMGAVTVYLTYLIGRETEPKRSYLALGAAAVNAFTPMFLFISGAVNNDNLAIMLASLSILLMVRMVTRQNRSLGSWIGLGLVLGLAALTKESTLGLIPIAFGTAVVVGWQMAVEDHQEQGEWRRLATAIGSGALRFAVMTLPAILIAGWWYVRNFRLYGDWLGWNAFIAVLGERPQPASLAQLWDERWGFMASYWGLFGGVNVPMPDWMYQVLNTLFLISAFGLLAYLGRTIASWLRRTRDSDDSGSGAPIAKLFAFVRANFGLVVIILFAVAVVYGLLNWARTTWSSQGRLVFTGISAFSMLFVLGLAGWMPSWVGRRVVQGAGLFFFLVACAAPFLWIGPAYEPAIAEATEMHQQDDAVFGARMRLLDYRVTNLSSNDDGTAKAKDEIEVKLEWEVVSEMTEDWSVFVHLSDPVLQSPIAQRDMYPGQGLLATSLLSPGQRVVDTYRLAVPQTVLQPSTLELVVGLYDYDSGDRLRLRDGAESLRLADLNVSATPGEIPNPLSANFGDELALVGYAVAPRLVDAGDSVELTMYWQALRPLDVDYSVFAQVLDNEDTTRWAASDILLETSAWQPGKPVPVRTALALQDNTPSDVYPLIVGAYTRTADGGFMRLQIVEDQRITMADFIELTKVRVR